jgi:hypothetical protein
MVVVGGDVVVTFAQKKSEASLIVEHFKRELSLAPEDISDFFAQAEADMLKERQAKAVDVVSKVITVNGRKVIVVDYGHPGPASAERARLYSVPLGQDLYRLNCSALAAQFAKYDPVFTHIAESFTMSAGRIPMTPHGR